MPSFDEYKQIASDRGSLAFEVFVVMSRPVGDPSEMAPHLPDHLTYIAAQERAGALVLSGPLSDTEGVNVSGIGLQVWRASSMAEAAALADADPMHIAGVKTYEIRRWLINEGKLQISVGVSTGEIALS